MRNIFFLVWLVLTITVCSDRSAKEVSANAITKEFTIYSTSVQNSFIISMQLPAAYYDNNKTKYPTVYLLDANFYFPILAATIRKYEKAGLLPPLILIGIGYKSFELMDSLRLRDYMYPAALPSDEITATGGGKKFNDFLISQLIPYVDSIYKTDKNDRALLGHSFGGYFSLFTLLTQLENHQKIFRNFAAASPSLWYNDFYLKQLTGALKNRPAKDSLHIFLTAGGLEDSTWNIAPVKKLANSLTTVDVKNVDLQYRIYSGLGHMDVSIITFTKALQEFYKIDQ